MMSRSQRTVNILGILLPFVGFVLAIVLLWDNLVGPEALAIAAVMYLISGFGITVGFHRLFAHRAFVARPAVRFGPAPRRARWR